MPAIMVSIVPLKFFAEANVESAYDEKQNDDSDKKQIQHRIRFKFSSSATGALPVGLRLFAPYYRQASMIHLINIRKRVVKFS